ncbi:MAG: hypothetical protein ACLT98_09880, partial [Eggerthellaceae bacterium]
MRPVDSAARAAAGAAKRRAAASRAAAIVRCVPGMRSSFASAVRAFRETPCGRAQLRRRARGCGVGVLIAPASSCGRLADYNPGMSRLTSTQ